MAATLLPKYRVELSKIEALSKAHPTDRPGPLYELFPGADAAEVLTSVWRALVAAGAITPEGPAATITISRTDADHVEVRACDVAATAYGANVPAQAALLTVAAERLANVLNGLADNSIEEIRHHT